MASSKTLRVVASEAGHFLFEANPRLTHEVLVTRAPQIIAVRDRAGNALTDSWRR